MQWLGKIVPSSWVPKIHPPAAEVNLGDIFFTGVKTELGKDVFWFLISIVIPMDLDHDEIGILARIEMTDTVRKAEHCRATERCEIQSFGGCDGGSGHRFAHLPEHGKRWTAGDIRAEGDVQAGPSKRVVGHCAAAEISVGIGAKRDLRVSTGKQSHLFGRQMNAVRHDRLPAEQTSRVVDRRV